MRKNIEDMISDCVSAARARNHEFTRWELEFIKSVKEQLEKGRRLSMLQEEILTEVWDKI